MSEYIEISHPELKDVLYRVAKDKKGDIVIYIQHSDTFGNKYWAFFKEALDLRIYIILKCLWEKIPDKSKI